MGVCFAQPRTWNRRNNTKQLNFKPFVNLEIKPRSENSNKHRNESVYFQLHAPNRVSSKHIILGSEKFWISECVLPGEDPREEFPKECQDLCFSISDSHSILLCLFDGHGKHGKKVVEFCKIYSENYFSSFKVQCFENPQQELVNLCERCDNDLKSTWSGVDAQISGCTAVFLYFDGEHLSVASVGDSRAIIASSVFTEDWQIQEVEIDEERKHYSEYSIDRNNLLDFSLYTLELTVDQKPDSPDEFDRISKFGGRVEKLLDPKGNRIGPYRVWQMNSSSPGLAMSRSIGDTEGSIVGVISSPICLEYSLNVNDEFIVLASDGIWDVMTNSEVAAFVKTYRGRCVKEMNSFEDNEVKASNTCIAHLLCEEARTRWFPIIEEEDVLIDDISCIVFELNSS